MFPVISTHHITSESIHNRYALTLSRVFGVLSSESRVLYVRPPLYTRSPPNPGPYPDQSMYLPKLRTQYYYIV